MADVTNDRLVRHDRLGADTGQRAELEHAVASSRARALCQRSRMRAVGCGNGRESGPRGRDVWLDSEHARTRSCSDQPNLRAQIEGQLQVEVEREIEAPWNESENLVSPFV